jgi:hypothetical protein
MPRPPVTLREILFGYSCYLSGEWVPGLFDYRQFWVGLFAGLAFGALAFEAGWLLATAYRLLFPVLEIVNV